MINADDYYGKEAYVKIHEFLVTESRKKNMNFCMAGFVLKNTLSDNGAVTRGICRVNEEGYLAGVEETGGNPPHERRGLPVRGTECFVR